MRFALLVVLGVSLFVLPALAADQPAAPAAPADPKAAPATPPAATTLPASPEVVATVGEVKIAGKQVDEVLRKAINQIPPDRVEQARQQVVSQMVMRELVRAYITAQKIELTEKEVKEANDAIEQAAKGAGMTAKDLKEKQNITDEMIATQAKTQKMLMAETSKEKTDAFLKDHPGYFNGTKVKASHILIKVDPAAATKDQKEAYARIQQIAADIEVKKVTFEDAAKANSACPSAKEGGDLGEFTFDRMVPPFAMTAFDMKVGEISKVVRTQFGLHLIKVTGRTDGKEPDAKAEQIAKQAMMALLLNKIIEQGTTTLPITVTK